LLVQPRRKPATTTSSNDGEDDDEDDADDEDDHSEDDNDLSGLNSASLRMKISSEVKSLAFPFICQCI
jgi:hypothetical protein